ncbi:MAG: N-acetyltransferase family protein [Bdellovibrionales bacterium]
MNFENTTSDLKKPSVSQRPTANGSFIEIHEVKNGSDFKKFLQLPQKIYTDPQTRYVTPLNLHMKMMIGRLGSKNKHLLLARENGEVVARLGVKVHRHGKKQTLNFGFFEALEGKNAAVKALVEHAHSLYPELQMMGPFHFRMEDPYIGVLVEGYDRDPYFLMPYNPPYYDQLLKRAGLELAMDLFTYEVENKGSLDEPIPTNAKRAADAGVTIRAVNPKRMKEDVRSIVKIFNDALSQNWGFEEFVDEQVKEMYTLFRLFIDHRVVAIAEKDGKAIGSLIMLPNFNPVIKSSKGKITPQLIWNFLRKKSLLKNVRGYALGVLREHHGLGVGSALTAAMFEMGDAVGYRKAEISWVLANNGPMNELSKAMGGKHNKVYRVYQKSSIATASNEG